MEIVPEIIKGMIKNIPFPKRMRWNDKELTFPRPIDYFALIYNNVEVPFDLDGIPSSSRVRGHYVQRNTMIAVDKIGDYESLLDRNDVRVKERKP